MKTIGLLGGTGWSSTIGYYTTLNKLVNERLGGYHSAKIILKSIDYHDIMTWYSKDHEKIVALLQEELSGLIAYKPDCIMICCNSLHKYYDMLKGQLGTSIPVMHAVKLVAEHLVKHQQRRVLLLATQFTLEDGFFEKILEKQHIEVVIPNATQRGNITKIHEELMQNIVTEKSKQYFSQLIAEHSHLDAVVLGCTEFPLVVDQTSSVLPIIDPVMIQSERALNFALENIIKESSQ